jgi:hypothetical protein
MKLRTLKDTPSWQWPEGSGEQFLATLRDDRAADSDVLIAAELAGDLTVMNDELAATLISLVKDSARPEKVRAKAAISLGPALEQADIEGFEDADDPPITESTFRTIQDSLRRLYLDATAPKEVRRRILEASVRAPQDWHRDAVGAAFAGDDEAWKLTSVFCMQYIRGFDDQILEALDSSNEDIHYEAVVAAGNWELDAAWPHIAALVTSAETDKPLRLAAIEAVATIRPHEATEILADLADSRDEDIADAADEALAMARGLADETDDDDDPDDDDDQLR